MPSFKQLLNRANRFLHSTTSIRLRPKPEVRLLYLNGKKGNIMTEREAIPINIKAHIIDHDSERRRVIQIGNSIAITHKPGWLDKIARDIDGQPCVETCFLLMENKEYGILLTTPKPEEKQN